ncbi:FG-GAP-like repeat-containing protein [Algibacter sp. 2305UL17-15]|uniref:FG-GAP-like repeat-containing protein n=1 Tax=Algibacter sp. 2305UL17-15 TaxID=3231268 RepID=UPI0034593115
MPNTPKHYFLFFLNASLFFNVFTASVAQNFQRSETIVGFSSLDQNNGAAVADYDGDLDLDIFVVAKLRDSEFKAYSKSRLFRNNSNGTFTDVTQESKLVNLLFEDEVSIEDSATDGFKNGVAWGDYDNDGFPDIFFTYTTKVQLFHNNGDGTFSDVTDAVGIQKVNNCSNTGATWFDANNDGFLDIYISDWDSCDYNNFYINNGNGTFRNAASDYFSNARKSTYTSIPFDFNQDGWMDLYVTQDFEDHNETFINQNGMGFVEQSGLYGMDHVGEDMGLAIGDINNDGFFDFYITTINKNVLLTNKGDNTFRDLAGSYDVLNTGWAWGTIFADFDLDGDEDLFVTNGYKENTPVQERNYYFKNQHAQGQAIFTDATFSASLFDVATSVTPVAFDYDNDGDLDLFVSNSDKASIFYENKTADSDENLNWFKVALQGTVSNRDAIGAIVSVTTNMGTQHRYNASITHLSQSLKPLHFGLDSTNEISEVKIKWPSGIIETYTDFTANQSILFTENNGFKVHEIPVVEKLTGCTDPLSCSYNPLATIEDNSCEYLTSGAITGSKTSGFLNTETYSYESSSSGSVYNWSVSGGDIIQGQNTNTISVKWGVATIGEIIVKETNPECSSEAITLQVNLSVSKLSEEHSMARLWNEALLNAIRGDFARPTVHARNLFHTSIALYDAWAMYDDNAKTYLVDATIDKFKTTEDKQIARAKTMSYAAYRLLSHRFKNSPNIEESQKLFDFLMDEFEYDINFLSTDYSEGNAAALGNFIAKTIIEFGNSDGARESSGYGNAFYQPVNEALFPFNRGNSSLTNPNRWQPLALKQFIDQSGNLILGSKPDFLSPEWGAVTPFSLTDEVKNTFNRDGNNYGVYHDPKAPPYLNMNVNDGSSESYKWGFSMVSVWGAHLDPTDNVLWDISPKSIGNIDISNLPSGFEDYSSFYKYFEGGDIGKGHTVNPYTNAPYEEQIIPRGDYTRVLAEFWADGPDSETPPGHWFALLNYVSDSDLLVKKLEGKGEDLNPLEWDVKSYFILGGAMHDAAISAWSIKGWYDYIRPISAIRYMAGLGQSSDSSLDNYNIAGMPLADGFIEIVASGDPLEGRQREHIGKIKLYTWRGHDYISDTETDNAGVDWILAENWWPYQRPSFVTPPFAGYVSGHSTYSRAAAEVMTLLTGDAYFPGGYGEFIARKNEFLVFEEGPSVDVKLQWATYRDASDQCSLSRIWGGIHPPADDIPGRLIGEKIGIDAFNFGVKYFSGKVSEENQNSKYVIHPNPTEGVIHISGLKEFQTISIFNLLGQEVKRFETAQSTVDISGLSKGIYLLKIDTNFAYKLVKE